MESLVQKIGNLLLDISLKTISDESVPVESIEGSLNELLENVKLLRPSDFNLNPDVEDIGSNEMAAAFIEPIKCYPVSINDLFTFAVMILPAGSKIPLHDHPNMYSIIKVIFGKAKYTSYTAVEDPNIKNKNKITNKKHRASLDTLIAVEPHMSVNLRDSDDPCLSTPTVGNYHEMSASGEAGVLIDIAWPPYERKEDCRYYSVMETTNEDGDRKFWLSDAPKFSETFITYCNYTGPQISL